MIVAGRLDVVVDISPDALEHHAAVDKGFPVVNADRSQLSGALDAPCNTCNCRSFSWLTDCCSRPEIWPTGPSP